MTDDRGYSRLPTVPTPITIESGPDADRPDFTPDFVPDATGPRAQWRITTTRTPRLAPWALVAAIVALAASVFVGWGIPVAIISVVAAIIALRRPEERRGVAVWALVLGSVATIYSAGWIVWYAYYFGAIG